ncbi:MAG: PspC domain-containing protein [Paraprevotella sp.]|nr:PspC domain-containing protein [Paraprevotella sp.]
MKKNITMNLFGTLYAIDEDAYELLNTYLNNMKRYFSHKEGGEEIADDIEHRMAELLNDLRTTGVAAINIDHVKGIVERIGNPEEMEGFEKQETPSDEEAPKGHRGFEWFRKNFGIESRKKLFRNPDDKIIGGVLSGIAYYFNIDAIWMRLLAILVFFFSYGSPVIAYLILWLVMPVACTPEDRLMMKGIPVNMENIHDEILGEARCQTEKPVVQRHSIMNLFFKAVVISCLCVMFLPFIAILLLLFFVFSLVIVGLINHSENMLIGFLGSDFEWIGWVAQEQNMFMFLATAISVTLLLILTICLFVRAIRHILGHASPLTVSQRTVYLVSWILLLIASGAFLVCGIAQYAAHSRKIQEEVITSQDSIVRSKDSLYLAQRGWHIAKSRNCRFYVHSGNYYTGERDKRYIAGQGAKGFVYEVEKVAKVAPGKYRLKAMARTDGNGCQIFLSDGKERYAAKVPVCYNSGGNLWENAVSRVKEEGEAVDSVWKQIAGAHYGRGYGWNEVVIEPVLVKGSSVRYGITNDCPDEAWTGTWFTATEFVLEKIK